MDRWELIKQSSDGKEEVSIEISVGIGINETNVHSKSVTT